MLMEGPSLMLPVGEVYDGAKAQTRDKPPELEGSTVQEVWYGTAHRGMALRGTA